MAFQTATKLIRPTSLSASFTEASKTSKQLLREYLRAAPTIVRNYELGFTVDDVRKRVVEEFRKHAYVTDPKIIDFLIFKGRSELADLVAHYKMKSHVERYLTRRKTKEDADVFLGKLYRGEVQDDDMPHLSTQYSRDKPHDFTAHLYP